MVCDLFRQLLKTERKLRDSENEGSLVLSNICNIDFWFLFNSFDSHQSKHEFRNRNNVRPDNMSHYVFRFHERNEHSFTTTVLSHPTRNYLPLSLTSPSLFSQYVSFVRSSLCMPTFVSMQMFSLDEGLSYNCSKTQRDR